MALKRKRISSAELNEAHAVIGALGLEVDGLGASHIWPDASQLARRHDLTLYDALYLELAMRRGLPLASFDKNLCRAALAAGAPLVLDNAD